MLYMRRMEAMWLYQGRSAYLGASSMTPYPYIWFWKSRLPERKGQPCRVLARSKRMNSILVEFEDGYMVITSRYAVRPA